MNTVRDAIHGNIELSDFELKLLDTPGMQRLRRIKQLGFSYLVYPSATHTRFEHSLGAFYLAGRASSAMGLDDSKTEKLKLAAMLHDIGHGPFSHSSEDAIKMHIDYKHEETAVNIINKGEIAELLKKGGYSPKEISSIAIGEKGPLSNIISGDVDIDRMDYLVRDAYYTGAAYGVIDLERIIQTLRIYKGEMCIDKGGLSAVESLFLARYLMYPSVYEHHTTRIANTMFAAAAVYCLRNSLMTTEELYGLDDNQMINKIKELGEFPGRIGERLENRELYKRALVLNREELGDQFRIWGSVQNKNKRVNEIEVEIAETAGLGEGEILLDVPEPLYRTESDLKILEEGTFRNLNDVSSPIKVLKKAQWSYWNLAVYCDRENVNKVKKAAGKILLGE